MLEVIKIFAVSFAALTNFLLGLLVLVRNPKKAVNIIFFFLSLFFTLWAFCLLFYEFPLIFSSTFWIKGTYFEVSVLVVLGLTFSFIFPEKAFRKAWPLAVLFSLLFLGLTAWLLFFTRIWIIGVIVDPDRGLQTLLGQGYTWWLLFVWGIGLWTFANLLIKGRRLMGFQKMQLKYIFYGYAFWAITINIPDTVIPLFFNDTRYFSISPIFNLTFSLAVAYAILKHRLMDIRLVLARTLSYALLSLFIVTFYVVGLFVFGQWLFPGPLNGHQLVISIILGLVVAYTFPSLKTFIEKITVKVFFKEHYEIEELLTSVSTILNETLDLDALIKKSFDILLSTMHLDFGGVILIKKNPGLRIISFKTKNGLMNDISPHHLEMLQRFKEKFILFDDLEEGQLKDFMRKRQLGFLARLEVKNSLIGFLFFGNKLSGDIYNNIDLQALEILTPQLGIAINNAQQYEEIRKFSEKLKQEVKKATTDLQSANQKLQNLDKMKDEFISVAAHELRAPMTAIKGYLSMILEGDAGKIPPKAGEFLQEATVGNERLIRLINNMLNVSRIEEGRLVYQMGIVKLAQVAKTVFNEFKLEAENKGLKINLVIPEGLQDQVYVDQDRIHEVVANLVSNAVKYTDKGSVEIKLFQPDKKRVCFEVADTGYGIPTDQEVKLFKKFSRLDSSTDKTLGTGLGLYIVKLLIDKFGGKIGFKSQIGKGSTFWFELPIEG